MTLLEVLDRAAAKVGQRFADQPELESVVRVMIARTYLGLGSLDKAEAQWRSLMDSSRRRDPDSAESFIAQGELAGTLYERGRRDAEVMKMIKSAAEGADARSALITSTPRTCSHTSPERTGTPAGYVRRSRCSSGSATPGSPGSGPDHLFSLLTLHNWVSVRGRPERPEAIALFERLRDTETAKLAPSSDPADPQQPRHYDVEGRKAQEADRALGARAGCCNRRDGADHPFTLTVLQSLATDYSLAGKIREAIPLLERMRDAETAKLGPDHPLTLLTLYNLAGTYQEDGRLREAIELYQRVRDAQIAKLGPDHPDTLRTLHNLAMAYWFAKQLDRSVPLLEDVLRRTEARFGRTHATTQTVVRNLGINYRDAGRFGEAIPLLEEAYRSRVPSLRAAGDDLFDAYVKAGRSTEAAKLVTELLADARKESPKESSQLTNAMALFGLGLIQVKAYADAEPLLRECLAIREKTQPDLWNTFNSKALLGGALLGRKKYSEAEPLLLAGYDEMKRREATIPPQGKPRLTEALERIVQLYDATNKPDESSRWRKELNATNAAGKPSEKNP